MESLTVRNLTESSLHFKQVEVVEDLSSFQSPANDPLWRRSSTSTRAGTAPRNDLQCLDLHMNLGPFQSLQLNTAGLLAPSSSLSTLMLRLTIRDQEDNDYHLDINPSHTQKSSQPCTPLSTLDSTLTALFHPGPPSPHLTLHTNNTINYTKWMSSFPAALPLSALSIPGTHNSHTSYRALPSVRCQLVDIATQFAHGIRFLDIRLQPIHSKDITKKDLLLVHGAFPVSLTGPKYFAPILQTCYAFLSTNPSETIIMSLKREGTGGASDEHFAQVLMNHYITPNASKWYMGDTIPTLGSARGKIVLLRRYKVPLTASSELQGLDATLWPDSAQHALFPSPVPTFCLQDFHAVLEPGLIQAKVGYCNEHLERAGACIHVHNSVKLSGAGDESGFIEGQGQVQPLYLNFLSASNFWRRACWPENIAKVLNRGVEEWLCRGHGLEAEVTVSAGNEGNTGPVTRKVKSGDGVTGIVIMDCVGESGDWDLVKLIIGMNVGVIKKWHTIS